MQSIFDGLDNMLNADDPEEKLIINQLQIRRAWDEKVGNLQPTAIYSGHQDLEINTGAILSADRIYENEVAKYSIDNYLLYEVADYLRRSYDRRGFSFHRSLASAIADPDQPNDETRIQMMGILLWGETGYDLRVPLLLTKKDDDKEFDFFFIMKLIRLDVVDMDAFLEYQMSINFDNHVEKFSRYLQMLIRKFQSNDVLKLGAGTVETILEWIKMKLPSTAEPIRIECVKIKGNLDDRHFNAFLDHLESVLNAGNEPKITKQDVELLKAHGLAVPAGENPAKITLRLKKGDKNMLYHYFHALWEKHGDFRGDVEKIEIARYLCGWFTNFEKVKPESLVVQLQANNNVREGVKQLFYNQK